MVYAPASSFLRPNTLRRHRAALTFVGLMWRFTLKYVMWPSSDSSCEMASQSSRRLAELPQSARPSPKSRLCFAKTLSAIGRSRSSSVRKPRLDSICASASLADSIITPQNEVWSHRQSYLLIPCTAAHHSSPGTFTQTKTSAKHAFPDSPDFSANSHRCDGCTRGRACRSADHQLLHSQQRPPHAAGRLPQRP